MPLVDSQTQSNHDILGIIKQSPCPLGFRQITSKLRHRRPIPEYVVLRELRHLLHHRELLDAAHILPDNDPEGEPVVSNGLSLCKLHHAAFDRHFVGIRDDYRIEVRPDILKETDGPMLVHGLQALHGRRIILPRQSDLRPNGDFLQRRYEVFKEAG
ncbi:MAG TPA: hypothetical protein ENF16_03945 [Bacteroidetes bacterium]|nr:hypothetical protein [Bacteroidota bacterium]